MADSGPAPRPRGRPASRRAPSANETPTWAERLLPLLVVALPLASGWAGVLLDSVVVIVDTNYREVAVYEGTWARNVRVLLFMAVLAVAVQALIAGVRRGRSPVTWFTVSGAVVLVAVTLRGGMDPGDQAAHAVAVLALLAAAVSRIDTRTLRMVAWLAVAYAATSWLYFLAGGADASRECRPDKCSFLGVLLTGGANHEQLLGLRIAFLLPAAAFLSARFRVPAVLLLLVTVLASGSRTAMAASLVSLIAVWLLSDTTTPGEALFRIRRGQRALHELLSFVPLGGLALSLLLFLLVTRDGLTSRGEIFSALRGAVLESPLVGPGREALTEAYSIGALSFSTPHEHSQGGYLLTVGGLVLLVLFVAGVLRLTQVALRPGQVTVVLFALAPSVAFVTEPIWSFDVSDFGFGTLVLTIMLLATVEHDTWRGRRLQALARPLEPLHRARHHQARV